MQEHQLKSKAGFVMTTTLVIDKRVVTVQYVQLYQHRPQIAWKGISHFRNSLNGFRIYKFQFLVISRNIDIHRQDTNVNTNTVYIIIINIYIYNIKRN